MISRGTMPAVEAVSPEYRFVLRERFLDDPAGVGHFLFGGLSVLIAHAPIPFAEFSAGAVPSSRRPPVAPAHAPTPHPVLVEATPARLSELPLRSPQAQ